MAMCTCDSAPDATRHPDAGRAVAGDRVALVPVCGDHPNRDALHRFPTCVCSADSRRVFRAWHSPDQLRAESLFARA